MIFRWSMQVRTSGPEHQFTQIDLFESKIETQERLISWLKDENERLRVASAETAPTVAV